MDLTGRLIRDTVLVRPETGYGYARASYEVNLGCNYDCEHCYLGEKMFAGMDWPGRERLLDVMADAGVLWLQLTGGEPLIDPLFAETHARAWDMGMMIMISSNGSRLDQPRTLDLLTKRRPYQLALSLYGATEESYDGMTRRRGSYRRFLRGLAAAHEAGLPMRINVVVSNRNAREIPQIKAIADRYGIPSYAPGRHADYTPGSPDLDRLIQLTDALSRIKVNDDPGPFKRAEDRCGPYLDDPGSASAFSGPVLTHSDWTPDNVLASEHRAWLIDWAWPTLGAGWTDPACWVLRLMASGGHTAHEAERQASRLPAFQAADPAHVDLFAAANVRLWDEIAIQHERLDNHDGTSRAGMDRVPSGPVRLRMTRHAPLRPLPERCQVYGFRADRPPFRTAS